ncbi:hypothetical protein EJ07DRAFT_137405 [Lizonia empirigonia]|nr:hypothetical protein EJ07DRAFT_137405 [Lizonia empirigonia]
MGGPKQAPAPAERRSHRKSSSVDAAVAHGQQSAQSAGDSLSRTPALVDAAFLDAIFAQHEQELAKRQTEYDNVVIKSRELHKQYRRVREQRDELKEKRSEIGDKYKELQKKNEDLKDKHDKGAEQHNILEGRFHFVNSRFMYFLDKIVLPYTKAKSLKWDDQTQGTIDVVVGPLVSDALEAGNLRAQVQALQKDMFARIDKGEAISDEQLAQDFRNLVGLIKTLSRTVRLTEQVDVIKILQTPILLHGVAVKHREDRAGKKCMIEAWVWSALLYCVFATPFSILGDVFEGMKKLWMEMFGADHVNNWPTPSTLCETWRCTTMDHVFGQMIAQEVVTQGKKQEDPTVLEESVLKARDNVSNGITARVAKISPTTDLKQVRVIVDKAFTLAVQMCVQRSRLQVTFPDVGAKFDKGSMVFRPDPDGNDVEDGMVAFVVNPGLTKWGDTHGKKLEHRYDIVPSLVQLEPIPEKSLEQAGSDIAKKRI